MNWGPSFHLQLGTQCCLMVVLPGIHEKGCLYEEAYQFRREKSTISPALKSHGADNSVRTETHRMHHMGMSWLSSKGFLQQADLRSSHQDDVSLKKLSYLEKNVLYATSPDDQRCLALICELPIASCPGKAHPALWSLDQKGTLQKRGSTRNSPDDV